MIKTLNTVEGRRIQVSAYVSPFEVAGYMPDLGESLCVGDTCPICSEDSLHAENVFAPELLT